MSAGRGDDSFSTCGKLGYRFKAVYHVLPTHNLLLDSVPKALGLGVQTQVRWWRKPPPPSTWNPPKGADLLSLSQRTQTCRANLLELSLKILVEQFWNTKGYKVGVVGLQVKGTKNASIGSHPIHASGACDQEAALLVSQKPLNMTTSENTPGRL